MHINNNLKYLTQKEFCTKYTNNMPGELSDTAYWDAPVLAPVGHEFPWTFCLEPCHLLKYAFPSSLHEIPLVPKITKGAWGQYRECISEIMRLQWHLLKNNSVVEKESCRYKM